VKQFRASSVGGLYRRDPSARGRGAGSNPAARGAPCSSSCATPLVSTRWAWAPRAHTVCAPPGAALTMHQGQARRASGSRVGLRWGITMPRHDTDHTHRPSSPHCGGDRASCRGIDLCLVVGRQWSSMFTDWPLVAVSVRAARAHLGLTRGSFPTSRSWRQPEALASSPMARVNRLGQVVSTRLAEVAPAYTLRPSRVLWPRGVTAGPAYL
jgi:hypothetical protein